MSNIFSDKLETTELIELITIAETTERYDDMCEFVTKLVKLKSKNGESLNINERNFLSVAFKNVVGSKRASWRTLSSGFDNTDELLVNKYKMIIESELERKCTEILSLLKENIFQIIDGNNNEMEVFYFKMAGDYNRYLCEFSNNNTYKTLAKEYYEKALNIAESNLSETDPTRLGLALNFSVCYYEILNQPEKACDLAKKAFDLAIEKLDTLTDDKYKDSTLIMQLLRDNLTLWTSQISEEEQNELDRKEREKKEKERKQAVVLVDGYIR
eukprot:203719_1